MSQDPTIPAGMTQDAVPFPAVDAAPPVPDPKPIVQRHAASVCDFLADALALSRRAADLAADYDDLKLGEKVAQTDLVGSYADLTPEDYKAGVAILRTIAGVGADDTVRAVAKLLAAHAVRTA